MKRHRENNKKNNKSNSFDINEETWVISDTHFGHNAILKYEPTRVEAMRELGFRNQTVWLVHNWNSTVAEGDLVLHLGDFAFKEETVFYQLNGRIILLIGNHDVHSIEKYLSFEKRFPDKFKLVQGVIGSDLKVLESDWVSGLIQDIKGKKVMFSHYPLVTEDSFTKGKSKETRDVLAEVFKKEKCDICVHGHLHSKDSSTNKSKEINVSIERIGFKPVKLKDLL